MAGRITYYGNIVKDGLVLDLDAAKRGSYPGSGTLWKNIAGVSNDGTLTNGPTFSSANGGSIAFDGVDDYINITTTVNVGNPNTICAFIKLSDTNSDTAIYGSLANGSDNWLGIVGDRVYLFSTEIADINNFTILGTTVLNTANTRWYFVTSVINGNTATLYLNGVQEVTTTKAFTIGGWADLANIGRRGGNTQRYFKGSISNVLGYNRALSQQEILQNYNAMKGRYGL